MTSRSWVEPVFSRAQVDRAGRVLIGRYGSDEDLEEALKVFSNWRAAHGYPLNTAQLVLRQRARRIASTAFVSQRHKRELSIVRKLERSGTMRLSQMQDIAGCRAVVNTIIQLRALRANYLGEIRDDYVEAPASSGYRSIHAVSRYQGKTRTAFDGLFVESQLRTALQHAWATAVETVDAFTGSDLKSGYGEPEWRRLFALIGSAFAIREECSRVPGTPTAMRELKREIRKLERQLSLAASLRGWHQASKVVFAPGFRFKKYILIEHRPRDGKVMLYTYGADEFEAASDRYAVLEQAVTRDNQLQVVMASADSSRALRRAYPNLFVDPTEFLRAYGSVLKT